jgi:peptidoglycan/xylan/chitin deacetylase (PgdA/CDA1 family)
VTIGAHTHTHPNLLQVPEAQLIEELVKPREIFQEQLGLTVQHFAYPKALWNEQVKTLVAESYTSAVIGNGQKALPGQFDPYLVPRVPIRRSDGWWFFLAKVRGWLEQEEMIYDKLRGVKRI